MTQDAASHHKRNEVIAAMVQSLMLLARATGLNIVGITVAATFNLGNDEVAGHHGTMVVTEELKSIHDEMLLNSLGVATAEKKQEDS